MLCLLHRLDTLLLLLRRFVLGLSYLNIATATSWLISYFILKIARYTIAVSRSIEHFSYFGSQNMIIGLYNA
jgi:hypothetical protein